MSEAYSVANFLKQAPYRVLDPLRPDGARWLLKTLRMPSDEFYRIKKEGERAALLTISREDETGLADALATAVEPLVAAETGAGRLALSSLCVRIGAAIRGAWVAALFRTDPGPIVVAFNIPQSLVRPVYDALGALLRSAPELEAQVYRTPVQYAQAVDDAFWASTTKGPHARLGTRPSGGGGAGLIGQQPPVGQPPHGSTDWASEYAVYRSSIDGLIEDTLCDFCGSGHVHVLEICAGDGSLAERLLRGMSHAGSGGGDGSTSSGDNKGGSRSSSHGASGPIIASYTCLERNGELADQARRKLVKFGEIAQVVQGDVTQRTAYRAATRAAATRAAATATSDGSGDPLGANPQPWSVPNLVISSGSVLCGQVGSAEGAEAALLEISDLLPEGGRLIATGFSISFLHPALLRRAKMAKVLRGSLPGAHPALPALQKRMGRKDATAAPPPPAHAFGRFQCFVLQKVGNSLAGGGGEELEDAEGALFSALCG